MNAEEANKRIAQLEEALMLMVRFENRFEKDKIVHGAGSARRPYGDSRKKIDLIHRTKKLRVSCFFQCLFTGIL